MSPVRFGALLVSLCLAAVIGWEHQLDIDPPAATSPDDPLPLRQWEPARLDQAWSAELLGRPLFRPDRKPPATEATVLGLEMRFERTRLIGVVVGPAERRAIFLPELGAKPVVVREGDRIGPYLVQTIQPGRVLLEVDGRTVTLMPSLETAAPPRSAAS